MAIVSRYHVLATVAKNPTFDYPFAVVAIHPNGTRSQEFLCRSRRDCLVCGGGIASGLMIAGVQCDPNVVFDERAFGPVVS